MQDVRAIVSTPNSPTWSRVTDVLGRVRPTRPDRDRASAFFVVGLCLFRRERRGSPSGSERAGAASRDRGRRTSTKAFRLPHEQRTTLKEYFLHPFQRTTYERQHALDDVSFDGRARRVLRDHRPERQRQEHAAEDPRRHLPAGRGARCACNGMLSPFIELGVGFNPELTARDNIRINGTLLGLHARRARRAVRRDRRVRRARAVRRPEAEELLVRDAGAARVLDRDPGRRSTSCCSTRCSPSATRSSRRSASRRSSASATTGKTIVFVSHDLETVAQLLRPGAAARGRRRAGDRADDERSRALPALRVRGLAAALHGRPKSTGARPFFTRSVSERLSATRGGTRSGFDPIHCPATCDTASEHRVELSHLELVRVERKRPQVVPESLGTRRRDEGSTSSSPTRRPTTSRFARPSSTLRSSNSAYP